MKAGVQTLSGSQTVEKSLSTVLAELFKARVASLVLLTTVVGYYLGSRGPLDMARLLNTLAGTGLLAAGAAALNQLLEREHDSRRSEEHTAELQSPYVN